MLEPHIHHIPDGQNDAGCEELGFKAYNLARMARLGLPVPEAFVLGTPLCHAYLSEPVALEQALRPAFAQALRRIEQSSGLRFGDARRPLLVSVRSGAPTSMPGMMDTLLDVGLCEQTRRGLLRITGNPRLVWDSYRRLVQSFAEVVHGSDPQPFRAALSGLLAEEGLARAQELDFRALEALTAKYLELYEDLVGRAFPQDPVDQLAAAVGAVFGSWMSARAVEYRRVNNLAEGVGTAVTVQRMVFGNAGGTSGAGVAFTRNPATGENSLYVDFLFNSQGEDVVSGRHSIGDATRLPSALPAVHAGLVQTRAILEAEFRDSQEFEFTVQDGRLYLLQTRSAKLTPWAALQIAADQVSEGLIDPATALERIAAIDLDRVVRHRVADASGRGALCTAVPASVGVAIGRIALDADAARGFNAKGETAILVREDTATEDIAGIAVAAGVLTACGGRTAHAAVVARQLGKVCLVGCVALSIDLEARIARIAGTQLAEGDLVCLDANEGRVYAGEPQLVVERPDECLAAIARWRDAVQRAA